MDITIEPRLLRGTVSIIPSKSMAHRLLICAAFADRPTQLHCPETNRDIEATVDCLNSLGAEIIATDTGYTVFPVSKLPDSAVLNCAESGSTLRFMLPIVGALGVDGLFQMEGRLPHRPLSPLWEEMERMGCSLTRPTENTIRCRGKLRSGDYFLDGGVSSQFITGMLFAKALMNDTCRIHIQGTLESKPYIDLTHRALELFTAPDLHSPGSVNVEGDWSNGAFWIAAQALGSELTILGLNQNSCQGDRAVLEILKQMDTGFHSYSVKDVPDLVPILSVYAALNHGAEFTDIQRLRLKESDRVASTIAMIKSLGGNAEATEDTMEIFPCAFTGGTVDAVNDHRIAMAAAIAATRCTKPVTIHDAQCVKKSYPRFWEEYRNLGGTYELDLR